VVLVCLLQHRDYEVLRQKCARPRRPTPPPPVDGDDDLHGGFVTPPRTPIAGTAPTAAALILNNEAASGVEAKYRSPKDVDSLDQTVPEVIRESSSDSEPAVSPAKQGKMSFGEEEAEKQKEKLSAPDHRQHYDDEDAPPDVFSSESMDEFHPTLDTIPTAFDHGQQQISDGNVGDAPIPMDVSTTEKTHASAETHQKSADGEEKQAKPVEH